MQNLGNNNSGLFDKLKAILESSNYHPPKVEIDNAILPASKLAEWDFYKKRVINMIENNNGIFPNARKAEKLGFSTVYHYATKYYGGISNVKKRLGFTVNKMGRHYWKNPENVKKYFLPICQKLGYFPTAQMIRVGIFLVE